MWQCFAAPARAALSGARPPRPLNATVADATPRVLPIVAHVVPVRGRFVCRARGRGPRPGDGGGLFTRWDVARERVLSSRRVHPERGPPSRSADKREALRSSIVLCVLGGTKVHWAYESWCSARGLG
jgi:hypothetical protein